MAQIAARTRRSINFSSLAQDLVLYGQDDLDGVLRAHNLDELDAEELLANSEPLRRRIADLRKQIEAVQKANSELAVQLDAAADGAKICYSAARNLGMVSAEGAEVVYLTAPQTRSDTDATKAAFPQARTGIYATLFGFLD